MNLAWPFFRRVEASADLREHGARGKATVVSMRLLGGTREFRLSRAKTAELLANKASVTRAKLRLRVELADLTPAYEVERKIDIPFLSFPRVGPGGTVHVLVDPDDHQRLEIDWEAEIVEPTAEQRAAADPLLAALLRRRQTPGEEQP